MREICIPISNIADDKRAEVEIRIPGTGKIWRYRLEPLEMNITSRSNVDTTVVGKLQNYIQSYNQNWELIQIFDMNEKTGNMHLLYREKSI